VSVGTLHYCFETKEHLLRALYDYIRAEFRMSLEGILYGENVPTETLSSMTKARLHLLESPTMAFRVWRAFTREAWTDDAVKAIVKGHFAEQRARLEAILVRGGESGELSGPAVENPRISAAIMVSVYEGLIAQWSIDPDAFTLDEYSRAIVQLCGGLVGDLKDFSKINEQATGNAEGMQ
jgi:AcrR family transcriptional regulator